MSKADILPLDYGDDKATEISKLFSQLRPAVKYELRRTLKDRFNECSVRTRNCMPGLEKVEDVIEQIYGQARNARIRNCGVKTRMEISRLLEEFQLNLESHLSHQDNNPSEPVDPLEEACYSLKERYDYLNIEECRKIARKEKETGKLSFIYIIRRYVDHLRTISRDAEIICLKYGIRPTVESRSMDRIAGEYGMTRERVRQIIAKGIPVPEDLQKELDDKVLKNIGNITSFEHEIWTTLSRDYSIDDNPLDVGLLVGAVLSEYTIVQLDSNDCRYLINRDVLKNSTLKTAFAKLKLTLIQRRTADAEFDICDFIMCKGKTYHPEYTELCRIIAKNIRDNFGFEVRNDRYIVAVQNKLDNNAAMEQVLLDYGRPMKAEDMWEEFQRRYPDAGIHKFTSFKAYLIMHERILARGKTGSYVHSSWDNFFAGSVTEYVAHLITANRRRYSINELIELISQEFSPTNRNNVIASLRMDQTREFVIHEDDSVGLRGVETGDEDVPEKRIVHRFNFPKRFEDLRKFVETHNRLPYSSSNPEEAALSRWIYNLDHRKIEATDEEYDIFKQYMASCSHLPQTRIEYKCREKCRELSRLVENNSENPMFKLAAADRFWIRKTLKESESFNPADHRREYLRDLCETLERHGYKI